MLPVEAKLQIFLRRAVTGQMHSQLHRLEHALSPGRFQVVTDREHYGLRFTRLQGQRKLHFSTLVGPVAQAIRFRPAGDQKIN